MPRLHQAEDAGLISEWSELWDKVYSVPTSKRFGADFTGWNSSVDGTRISQAELQLWLEDSLYQIRLLGARRILEIGVGRGNILAGLINDCDAYWATDISQVAVAKLTADLSQAGLENRVHLLRRAADDLSGIPAGYFDLIILNSVIQYFPNNQYLADVLTGAAGLLCGKGSIFIGDVRHRGLKHCFQAMVLDGRNPGQSLSLDTVAAAVAADRQLAVTPDFFHSLDLGITSAFLKPGPYRNELSRFRYDVIIRVGQDRLRTGQVVVLTWGREVQDIATVRKFLQKCDTDILRINGIRNERLLPWLDIVQPSVADQVPAARPETFHELARAHRLLAQATWSDVGPDRFDVMFAADPSAFVGFGGGPGKAQAAPLVAVTVPSILPPRAWQGPSEDSCSHDVRAQLRELLIDIIGTDDFSDEESMITIGLDSISVLRLVHRARRLGIDLSVQDVFIYKNISAISSALSARPTRH